MLVKREVASYPSSVAGRESVDSDTDPSKYANGEQAEADKVGEFSLLRRA